MMKRTLIGATLCLGSVVGFSAGSVLAGEVNGNGDPVKAKDVARSDCAFSGLEDDDGGPNGGPGVAPQNWGQIVKSVPPGALQAGADGPHEAPDGSIVGCNAHLYPINLPD
jgi:hypothetical protein